MIVQNVTNFFVDMKDDVTTLIKKEDSDQTSRNLRIASVVARALGVLGIATLVGCMVALAATFTVAPVSTLIFLVIAVAGVILCDDLIIVGNELQKSANRNTSKDPLAYFDNTLLLKYSAKLGAKCAELITGAVIKKA
jgi:uncharacterized membrane protein